MKKKIKIIISIIILLIVATGIVIFFVNKDDSELKSIKSEGQLLKIYEGEKIDIENNFLLQLATMPFSAIALSQENDILYDLDYRNVYESVDVKTAMNTTDIADTTTTGATTKDYSTTNIQVENVDEADITKTDGDYIYSISDNNVVITDVRNPNEIKIAKKIESFDNNIPEDIILYNNKLVVISSKGNTSNYYSKYNGATIVEIYDITDKENPKMMKDYELNEPYYTSRCINGELYVISLGNLRKENNKISTYYKENSVTKDIKLDNIKYLKDIKTKKQTLISSINLNNVKEDVNVNSYLIDISNAYVSENSIYLLNQKYQYSNGVPPISSIFGPAGIFGAFFYENDIDNDNKGYYTDIYKFDISNNGKIEYKSKTKTEGKTINQYSVDEKNGHLRVALYDDDGSRIVIFNEKLEEIGRTANLAKGEKMYSSRFIGDKAYLVTYKTIDPLFVIDLTNEKQPTVLGKLKIPGYSTYLHPYDEKYLIGIGMETEEIINRDSTGKVRSTTAKITGMKMALFDISDVENPKQVSNVVIGDSRTTSAILTNPKALLFSKEKGLIAIPVNNYKEDFVIETNSDEYSTMISSYTNNKKEYVAEGYFVYSINTTEGFTLKGVITHENTKKTGYSTNSKLLRGLYIENNLYTVSETAVKVNNLETLEQINELKIR